MSRTAANFIIQYVKENPSALLSFPGGNTPAGTYRYLVDSVKMGSVDFSQATFIGLDEWVGLDKEDEGSCQHFMYKEFFIPSGVKESQIHFFNAKAGDLEAECKKIDDLIFEKGGIDFILLGLGVNGHLGFNEPGTPFNLYSHVIQLDSVTKAVGQKYFKEQRELSKGITLGIRHILDAKTVMLIANGLKKADAVKGMLNGPMTDSLPGSVLQEHSNTYLFFDEEAYSKSENEFGL